MIRFFLLTLFLQASMALGFGNRSGQKPLTLPQPSADLQKSEVIRFSDPGPTEVGSRIKCGLNGDIFALYSSASSLEMWSVPIRRVSVTTRRVTEYPVPNISGYDSLVRVSFDVTAEGSVLALIRANPKKSGVDPVYLVVKYKDDGQVDWYFTVGDIAGKTFFPKSLSMFRDGSSLISGTTIEKAEGGSKRGVFSGIFGQDGTFRAPVTLMQPDAQVEGTSSAESANSAAVSVQAKSVKSEKQPSDVVALASSLHSVSSKDGYIYMFQEGGQLQVVSPDGSVDREFRLKPPSEGLSALQMASAGPGLLFVFYNHIVNGEPGENSRYHGVINVVDPQSGESMFLYRMPQAEISFVVPACAVSPNDFLFIGSDRKGYLSVTHYLPH